MSEVSKITSTEKTKDPRRVEAGKRLAAISKQAKERKAKEREEQTTDSPVLSGKNMECLGLVVGIVGVVVGVAGLYYKTSGEDPCSNPEPKDKEDEPSQKDDKPTTKPRLDSFD